MIQVRRINGTQFIINDDLIETIEATPDTVITLTTGKKVVVADSPEEITKKVVEFRRAIGQVLPRVVVRQPGDGDGSDE